MIRLIVCAVSVTDESGTQQGAPPWGSSHVQALASQGAQPSASAPRRAMVTLSDTCHLAGKELTAVMSLLLQLGCLEPGNPLPLAALSPTDRGICLDLAYMGLLLPFW